MNLNSANSRISLQSFPGKYFYSRICGGLLLTFLFRKITLTFSLLLFCVLLIMFNVQIIQAQTAPISRDQQEFEKLSSRSASERSSAVQYFSTKNDETAYDLIKSLLLKESTLEVQEKILQALEKRKSRKDFFTLLDFIRISFHESTRLRAMKLLMEIHPPRLRYEIEQAIAKSPDLRILLYGWLVSFQNPDEQTKTWFLKVFRDTNAGEFFLTLRSENDEKIALLLKPYLMPQIEFSTKHSINLYWKLLVTEADIPAGLVYSSGDVTALPSSRRIRFFRMADKRGVKRESSESIENSSPEIKSWLTLKELSSREKGSGANRETMKLLLSARISASQFYYLVKYSKRLQNEERQIIYALCQKTVTASDLCLRYLLKENSNEAYAYWQKLPTERKVSSIRANFAESLRNEQFQNGFFLNWIMLNPRRVIRLKAVSVLPESLLKKFEPRICALVVSEPEGIIKVAYMTRFINSPTLETYCANKLSVMSHFKIPEKPTTLQMKTPEKLEKKADDIPGETPKP